VLVVPEDGDSGLGQVEAYLMRPPRPEPELEVGVARAVRAPEAAEEAPFRGGRALLAPDLDGLVHAARLSREGA